MSAKQILAIAGAFIFFAIVCLFFWRQAWIDSAITEVEKLNGAVDWTTDMLRGPQDISFDTSREPLLDDNALARLLPYLKRFSRLTDLDLCGTKVTSEGLQGIHEIESLTRLDVPATCISEKSIPAIARIGKLKALFIYGSVSDALSSQLSKSLPSVEIWVGGATKGEKKFILVSGRKAP